MNALVGPTASPISVITAFCAMWGKTRQELHSAFEAYFTDATVWENVGMGETVGIEPAFAMMDRFYAATGVWTYQTDIVYVAAGGPMVLTERLDHFLARDGTELHTLRLMGIFEVSGLKIVAWRDYFDSALAVPTGFV